MADTLSDILARNAELREERDDPSALPPVPDAGMFSVEDAPQEEEQQGGLLRGAGEVAKGIGAGLLRGPAMALGGFLDLGGDVGEAAGDALTPIIARNEPLARGIAETHQTWVNSRLGQAFYRYTPFEADGGTQFARSLSGGDEFAAVGNDMANAATAEIVAVMGGYSAVARRAASATPALAQRFSALVRQRNVQGVVAANTTIGVVAGVVIDPDQERMANFLQDIGLENDFVDWLANDDTDGAIESRIKNVIEESLVGYVADGVFISIRGFRAMFRGDKAGAEAAEVAARENLSSAVEDIIGEGRSPTGAAPTITATGTPQEAASQSLGDMFSRVDSDGTLSSRSSPQGGSPTSLPEGIVDSPPTATPSGTGAAVQDLGERQAKQRATTAAASRPASVSDATMTRHVDDTNRALILAGVDGTVDASSLRLAGDGAVILPSAWKRALDEAGLGAPFISASRAVREGAVVFRASTEDGARIVGTMGREDLARFSADVRLGAASDAPADILKGAPNGQYTLSRLGNTQNMPYIMRALVDQLPPNVSRSMKDVDLQSAATQAADAIGQDPTAVLDAARILTGSAGNQAVTVATLRTLWTRSGSKIDELIGTDWLTASNDMLTDAAERIHNAVTLGAFFTEVKSGLGRGLRSLRLEDADSYIARVGGQDAVDALGRSTPRGEIHALPTSPQEITDWIELWRVTGGSPRKRALFLQGLTTLPSAGRYVRTSAANMFTANVLSGVPSILLNVVGPTLNSGIRTIEKITGGYARGMLDPTVTAAERVAARHAASDSAYAYVRTFSDIAEAFNFGKQAARARRPILGGGTSIDNSVGQFGPLTRAVRDAERRSGVTPETILGSSNLADLGYGVGNLLNTWPGVFARLNNGLDEMAKRVAYLGEGRVRILEQGRAAGLSGDDLRRFVEDKLPQLTDDVGAATDKSLLRAAERTTLTGQPGAPDSAMRRLATSINGLRHDIPEVRFLLPIFNVPANALGETMRRVPFVNRLMKESMEDLRGLHGVTAQNEAWGRNLFGAAFLTAGGFMSSAGILTGGGPRNPRDRAVWLQTHQPWSIRIGDKWINYARYDVLGGLLGIPAALYDASVYHRMDKGWEDLTYGAVASTAEYFRDRAAIQTIADVFNIGTPGNNPERTWDRIVGNAAARMVVPNFVTQLGRNLTDETLNVKTGWFEIAIDAAPGLSLLNDPIRNTLGEPVNRPQNTFLENLLPLTAAPAVTWQDDVILDEINRLYEETGYAAGVRSQSDISGGYIDAREIDMPDGRSLFDLVMERRMTTRVDGFLLREALSDLFTSDQYDDAVDADASVRESSNGMESRGFLVSRIFTSFNEVIKEDISNEFPEAAMVFAVVDAKRRDNHLLRDYSAEDLIDNPDIFEALGIDLDAYIANVTGDDF